MKKKQRIWRIGIELDEIRRNNNDVKNIFMNYLVTGTAGFIGTIIKRLFSKKK